MTILFFFCFASSAIRVDLPNQVTNIWVRSWVYVICIWLNKLFSRKRYDLVRHRNGQESRTNRFIVRIRVRISANRFRFYLENLLQDFDILLMPLDNNGQNPRTFLTLRSRIPQILWSLRKSRAGKQNYEAESRCTTTIRVLGGRKNAVFFFFLIDPTMMDNPGAERSTSVALDVKQPTTRIRFVYEWQMNTGLGGKMLFFYVFS